MRPGRKYDTLIYCFELTTYFKFLQRVNYYYPQIYKMRQD